MKRRCFFVAMSVVMAVVVGAAVPIARGAPREQAMVVTSTADSGPGSLREALERATPGTTITFDPAVFPRESPATIAVMSALPQLAQGQVTIDASDAGVILDGRQLPPGEAVPGLSITSNGNVIRGLQILHFTGSGVDIIDGAQNNLIGGASLGQGNVISGNHDGVNIVGGGAMYNTVIGNYIGTDASGMAAMGNAMAGVWIGDGAQHNVIGGATTGERNIISGNGNNGVVIGGIDTMFNTISGNYIGTDARGMTALGNQRGVHIGGGARHNVVGGATEGERNIISGNTENGLVIQDIGTMSNIVIGNYIGTDASGEAALGNAHRGVGIFWAAQNNRIGGTTPGERNVISGNSAEGVGIENVGTDGNSVIGNFIGTDANGSAALGNGGGVAIFDGAQGNIIGGNMAGEGNIISGNDSNGVMISARKTVFAARQNTVSGNYIGTDASGTEPLGNLGDGVIIDKGAVQNIIGSGNIIAYNGQDGVRVQGSETLGNTITANSIYDNEGLGIQNLEGGNAELPPPTVTYVGSRLVRGTAPPKATVEIFSDEEDQGRVFEGSTIADEEGNFAFRMPVGRFSGPNVTATATDAEGNTSRFSSPESSRTPVVTRELPNIVAPTQVSIEPKVVGTNLGLALFSVLFFGLTSTIFNSILVDYRDQLVGTFGRLIPRPLTGVLGKVAPSLCGVTEGGRGRLLLMWLTVLLVTSAIESFLAPGVGVLSPERLGILMTLFISAVVVSGLELGSDLYAHGRWAPTIKVESKIQWIGIAIAVACVILSRALDFKPGYLYGIVGAIYLLPKLADITNSGKRAIFVLLSVFAGALILWIATAFLPAALAELEPLFLTIFLISLQGVFFELFPLAVTDGGNIWSWRRGVWFAFFSVVFFCFYHFLLNPTASDVQALQQNGVQTLLISIVVFGLFTLLLWLLFPFRLERKRASGG